MPLAVDARERGLDERIHGPRPVDQHARGRVQMNVVALPERDALQAEGRGLAPSARADGARVLSGGAGGLAGGAARAVQRDHRLQRHERLRVEDVGCFVRERGRDVHVLELEVRPRPAAVVVHDLERELRDGVGDVLADVPRPLSARLLLALFGRMQLRCQQ